jgi:hypothetical protein
MYARTSGDVWIAYQVVSDAARDLVLGKGRRQATMRRTADEALGASRLVSAEPLTGCGYYLS